MEMLLCVLNLLLSTSLFFAMNMETMDMQSMALEAWEEFVVSEGSYLMLEQTYDNT